MCVSYMCLHDNLTLKKNLDNNLKKYVYENNDRTYNINIDEDDNRITNTNDIKNIDRKYNGNIATNIDAKDNINIGKILYHNHISNSSYLYKYFINDRHTDNRLLEIVAQTIFVIIL